MITYRFGDLPLLLAAVLLYQAFDSWSLSVIFERIASAPDTKTIFDLPLVEVVGSLVAVAAFARSAQILLHTWLPYSMSGPTPVSALMHAGIVNAGGFLINRLAPLFVETGSVLHWVFAVGLVTAVFGSVLMLTQNDVKKALGYSTMGQMGFMIMECGVGAFSLAIYHLIAHGLFKGTLFLGAGEQTVYLDQILSSQKEIGKITKQAQALAIDGSNDLTDTDRDSGICTLVSCAGFLSEAGSNCVVVLWLGDGCAVNFRHISYAY